MMHCTKSAKTISIFLITTILITASHTASLAKTKKEWTLIGYIAADNDLRGFAARNIKQMAQVGSNKNINIVAQLDIRTNANSKVTRRYFIEKNKIRHMNANDNSSQRMDSGNPQTLISCCKWAIENYPANHYALILWNHGTGIIDPITGKTIKAADLFNYNPDIHKLELDRSLGFLEFVNGINEPQRGICWDDSTGHYLTNQKLENALSTICTTMLNGKKLDLIIFDACLMSMLEVGSIIKKYANIMTGSQEVELGTGLDYSLVLAPFKNGAPSSTAFASHLVNVYKDTYERITNDYTHSAINLNALPLLETNIDLIAQLLLECLQKQKNNSVKKALQASRKGNSCTHFDEPSYIDLHHLLKNIQNNLKLFSFTNQQEGAQLTSKLNQALSDGQRIIREITIANIAGKNLNQAKGLSIYFPERRIHSSYRKTSFATQNHWCTFLTHYLLLP